MNILMNYELNTSAQILDFTIYNDKTEKIITGLASWTLSIFGGRRALKVVISDGSQFVWEDNSTEHYKFEEIFSLLEHHYASEDLYLDTEYEIYTDNWIDTLYEDYTKNDKIPDRDKS